MNSVLQNFRFGFRKEKTGQESRDKHCNDDTEIRSRMPVFTDVDQLRANNGPELGGNTEKNLGVKKELKESQCLKTCKKVDFSRIGFFFKQKFLVASTFRLSLCCIVFLDNRFTLKIDAEKAIA